MSAVTESIDSLIKLFNDKFKSNATKDKTKNEKKKRQKETVQKNRLNMSENTFESEIV